MKLILVISIFLIFFPSTPAQSITLNAKQEQFLKDFPKVKPEMLTGIRLYRYEDLNTPPINDKDIDLFIASFEMVKTRQPTDREKRLKKFIEESRKDYLSAEGINQLVEISPKLPDKVKIIYKKYRKKNYSEVVRSTAALFALQIIITVELGWNISDESWEPELKKVGWKSMDDFFRVSHQILRGCLLLDTYERFLEAINNDEKSLKEFKNQKGPEVQKLKKSIFEFQDFYREVIPIYEEYLTKDLRVVISRNKGKLQKLKSFQKIFGEPSPEN